MRITACAIDSTRSNRAYRDFSAHRHKAQAVLRWRKIKTESWEVWVWEFSAKARHRLEDVDDGVVEAALNSDQLLFRAEVYIQFLIETCR